MKKKVLSLFVTFAMLFSMLPATALAAGKTVAKIGETTYETFSDAMTAANGMTGNVVVDICGAVEFVNGMELKGSYDSITFNKGADGASITINQTAGGDYLEAHGKTVAFNDLTLAKANPAWAGNSGHMGNYFSIQGGTVTYTNCTFPNGACTSTGTATYDNCTFQNTSEYGLWVYDDALVTVKGGTINSAKGIKVYSEDETSVTSTLTVQNTTFTKNVIAKPAVAVGYARSITLIGNTYDNSTGVLELDSGSDADCEGITFVAKDSEGNDIGSTLTAVDRSNGGAACGVLMDGKIYTTVTEAAKDSTSSSSVTLLHESAETVEFAEGVTLNKNGYTAADVTVAGPVLGVLGTGVVTDDADVTDDSYIYFDLTSLAATQSIEIKLYSGDTLLSTTALVNSGYLSYNTLSAKVEITDESSSWDTTWAVDPISNLIPDKAELYVDGTLADTVNQINMYNTDYPANAREWKDIEGVATAPEGTITPAYTRNDGFWGEGTSNAAVSYVVELYEGETKIASASLNNVGGIIDGTVKTVTWSIPFADSTDEYWTVVWADGYPTATMRPDAVKLIVDGTLVDTNDVQFNAPDNLNKIVASTADSSGALTGYYTTLADALTSAKNGDKIELLWTEGDAPISMAGSVVGNKTVTITGTATVDWTKGDLFIGRGGEGNGKVIFDGANITSSVKKNPASTGIHVSGDKKTDSSVNYGTLEIKNSTIELDYLINRNETVIDGNSTLTVYGGCYTHGRDESESISGTDETATLTIGTGSTVNVINENGMGVGGEGNGVMTVKGTYNANVLNVSSKGTVNIGGSVKINGAVNNSGSIKLTETGATLTSQQVENVTSGVADYDVEYANGAYKLVAKYVAKIGNVGYNTFEKALDAVQDGGTITLMDAEGDESGNEIDFTKDISFTITGEAPDYALPVVTFQNATVNIENAVIKTAELDARQNATINVVNSTVYSAGGDPIVKSYYNGAINISGTSKVYTHQLTTMGYITISDTAEIHVTWQTNVYGNGMLTVEDTAVFDTAALHLTGKDYSGRDNTDADRLGKPAAFIVDGATVNVGKVLASNGADYSYLSSEGINVGTVSGKKAELNVVNGGKVNIYMANGETANIGADGTVNIDNSFFGVSCRAENGTVTLVNNGTINVSGASDIAAPVTGSGWVYMNGVTLDADTKLTGAKVRFASGTNSINGATIDDGFFQVGIGAYKGVDAKVDTDNGVIVNVKNAKIGSSGSTYAGWIGTGFYDTDAEKAAAMTNAKYVLNIENSVAEFGYLHISNDGELNVKGNAAEKATYNNSDYSFYAGDFIVNGTANFDATDVLALYTKVSCDNGTDKPGTVNIKNGTYYEAERHNGAVDGTNFTLYKTGVVNVEKGAELYIGEYTSIAADAKMNIGGTATALGAITNNGTITLTDAAATLTTTEVADAQKPESGVKYYYVTYANNAYKLVTDYVAEVNGTPYTTLAAAVDVGGEVKLLTDVTENVTIPDGATLTIDLNQKTLNGYVAPCTPASLTIKNGSIVNNESSKSAIEVNAGSLTLTDVNVSSARHAVRIDGAVTATIDGGNYTLIATSGSTQHAVNVSGDAAVTIKDGTFVGPKGTTMDSGAAVNVQAGSAVNIEGGNFTNGKNDTLASKGTLTITGGTFDQDPSAYVAEGYEAVEDSGVWTVQRKTYTITFDVNGGNDSNSTSTTKSDGTVTLPSDPTRSGYTFKGWYTASSGGTKVTASTVFTADTTVYAQWTQNYSGGGGGSYTPGYSITAEDTENGSISLSPKSASSGTTVTITVDPDKGYVLGTLTVLDKNGKEIELTKKADNKYTFKMPSGKVTVEATFMEDNTMLNYFVDVFASDYYYDAVLWAVENGITNGTSATTFSPTDPCTRAQMATFLWRAAGSPEPAGSTNPFVDVPTDAYYAKAVQWAYEQGITGGTSATTFSPDETCTRGQMATFLWRDAGSSAVSGEGAPFVDVPADGYYATAVDWAYEEGITGGTSATTYSPNDPCTRGQMVTFLYRYLAE